MRRITTAFVLIPFVLFCLCLGQTFAEDSLGVRYEAADQKQDVLIIGAGLAGMSTAFYLKKAGISFTILEVNPRIGGRVQSARYGKGLVVEAGLAEFWEKNPALQIIRELGLPLRESLTFSSVRIDGKINPYVQDTDQDYLKALFNSEEYAAFIAWDKKMEEYNKRIAAHKIDKELMELTKLSFGQWLLQTSGLPHRVQEFIRLTLEVEIGSSIYLISALDGIDEWGIFVQPGEKPFEIEGGNWRLIDSLADFVGREHIVVNTRAKNVHTQKDGRVAVVGMNTADLSHKVYQAKYVVSTVPLYRLFEIDFSPPLSKEKQEAISTQRWGSYFVAHVFFDPKATKFWTVDETSILPVLTDTALGVVYDGNPEDENPEQKVISLLTVGPHAESFNWQPHQGDIRDVLKSNFESLWPGSSKFIRGFEFYRYHPRAIAAWPVGRSRFDKLSDAIRTPEHGVYLAGDFTQNSHSSGAVMSAQRVTRDIARRMGKKIPEPVLK